MLELGKAPYFTTIMDTNRDLAHQSQNGDKFPTFSLLLEFFNVAESEKNNRKGDSASAPSRFASLSAGEVQQILTDRHSGKTKQRQTSLFHFEIVKTRAFNRKFQIKLIPILPNVSLNTSNHF